MEVSLQWDAAFHRLARTGLLQPATKAARMAASSAARSLRAGAGRYVRSRKALRVATVNKALAARFPRTIRHLDDVSVVVVASGKAVPLFLYPHRQARKGVSVAVNKGQRKLIPSAFVALVRGHRGVFRRVGAPRLPIKELYGSSVADALRDTEVPSQVLAKAADVFRETFTRVLELSL